MHGFSEPPIIKPSSLTLTSASSLSSKPVGLKTKIGYYILNNYFTHVVAVSQEMKNTLIKKYHFREEKVAVIYNGIPLPNQPIQPISQLTQSTNRYFHIGTVGRMVPVKDFNLFLGIAAEMKKQIGNVRFSILGDGPLKEELVKKVKELNIQNYVEFLTPRPVPFPYYQSLDLYLNTSLHEGIPLSILEAMTCGKPVIAPKVGGIPEIISDGEEGILIETREPKMIADSCLRLMQDKDLIKNMGEKASKRIASYFSNSKMAKCYQRLYSDLTSQP
jgi:glycosyltransferase involved in cell wall biosynthesis